MRLITDFDGVLVDISERYYRVYQFCLAEVQRPGQPVRQLTKSEFWDLKRAKVPERQIGMGSGLDEAQADAFTQLREETAHTSPYFQYDVLIPGVVEALTKLQAHGIELMVMTLRRIRELDYAFQQHEVLNQFFPPERRYCLRNDYFKTSDTHDKPQLMRQTLQTLPPASPTWMVGDTESDILAAQPHNMTIIGVLSGIRDREQLMLYQPDHIVADLAAAVELVLTQPSRQMIR